jgi:homoserine O-acetyltransferase
MSVGSASLLTHGAWRDGDHHGERRFLDVGALGLERGGRLPEVMVAYETWGTLNDAGDNAVLVEHALTGDSHVVGESGPGHVTGGWWPGIIGPGAPLDSNRFFVVAMNVLGGCQGTTGPSSSAPDGRPWGSRFPFVTIRDQVEMESRVAEQLGVQRWRAVLGGSMGGMRALEWVATHPERVAAAIILASTPWATAEQIGWCQAQVLAIRSDPDFNAGDYYDRARGPETGLGIARRIAHITYRSEADLHDRFGRETQPGPDPLGGGGRYAVESYLDHHAGKLSGRFDANSYVVLSEAMNSLDIGRDRGGVEAALAPFTGELVVASVDSDRLYPPRLSDVLAAAAPRGAARVSISSPVGHDGFLTETEQVGRILGQALRDRVECPLIR